MVYMFKLGDYPDSHTLGDANRQPSNHRWYKELRPLSKQTSPIEDWKREFYPTVVTVDSQKYNLTDFLITAHMYCISSKAKTLIEQVEPDLHQFLEVELQYGREKHTYYLLMFGRSESLFDVEASDVEWKDTIVPRTGQKFTNWFKKHLVPLVFHKKDVLGKHLWQSIGRVPGECMSDELHDLFEKEDITGLRYEKQLVV